MSARRNQPQPLLWQPPQAAHQRGKIAEMTPDRFREIIDALGHGTASFARAIEWPHGLIRGIARGRYPCPENLAAWMEQIQSPPEPPPRTQDWRNEAPQPEKMDG
jgi:hypothetical protein